MHEDFSKIMVGTGKCFKQKLYVEEGHKKVPITSALYKKFYTLYVYKK